MGRLWQFPKALKLAGMSLQDIGLIELNEAFAAQSLAVIRELGLNLKSLNVNGGRDCSWSPAGLYWSETDYPTDL